jgi:hypothetical protein
MLTLAMFLVLVASYPQSVSIFFGPEKVAYCQNGTIALLPHKPMAKTQRINRENQDLNPLIK